MKIILTSELDNAVIESLGDGTGIRLVVFTSGCPHRCKGCQNPRSWNINQGIEFTAEEVVDYLVEKYHAGRYQGITFSGGDPLYQSEALHEVLSLLRKAIPDINIWCYTGYRFEDIQDKRVLSLVDVLVDGLFEKEKMYPRKKFRGSNNQRILHLKNGQIKFIE